MKTIPFCHLHHLSKLYDELLADSNKWIETVDVEDWDTNDIHDTLGVTHLLVSTVIVMAAGEYVELQAYQNSTIVFNSEVADGAPHFAIQRIA